MSEEKEQENEPLPSGWWAILKGSLSGKQYDYTEGSLSVAVVLLAVPMVLEMALESLFAVFDIFWVAKLGSEATAAVGLTESMLSLYYAVAFGLSMMATATVARRVGEKRYKAAAQAGAQAVILGVIVGVVTGVACWNFAPDLLELMGADEATVAAGAGYTRLILGTNTVVMLLFLHNAIFRGAGDAALAMRALWIGNGINLVLDPLLIFGWGPFPEMGLEGAAVATVFGRGVAVCYQLWALCGGRSRLALRGDVWRPDFTAMWKLVRLSIGGILQMAVGTTSWIALMKLMATFGSVSLAGYTIGIRILIFTILPSFGLSNAAATLVGQNLGAGKPERAEKAVWIAGVVNMIFLGVVMVTFLLWAPHVVGIFTDVPGVLETGTRCLQVVSFGYVFFAWGMVLTQGFNGAGDTMTPTWLNLGAFWVTQLPLAWWLVRRWELGPDGIFWAIVVADGVLAVSALVLFRRGTWKDKEV